MGKRVLIAALALGVGSGFERARWAARVGRPCTSLAGGGEEFHDEAVARARRTVALCATTERPKASGVLEALDVLRASRPYAPTADSFEGTWELVFTSSLASVPFLDGYMPNKELLVWDLERGVLDLEVATLPFVPKIAIRGEQLHFEDSKLTYVVGGKPPSTWDVFHADGDVIAADSSATGTNVIRRVSLERQLPDPPQ